MRFPDRHFWHEGYDKANLVRKRKKPIVLMVDEAHDLHHHTLTGLKRLIEMVADGEGKLCVLLAGHPTLRRDLRNPTMEEIGYRTAVFSLEGKGYAVPIGAEKGDEFKIYSDDIFFIEDPHDLYKHWPAEVWKEVDAHEVQAGMSELQASFAIGMGIPEGSGDYGSRTLHYPNGGKPLVIAFENDKAVEIKPGS